MSCDSDAEGAQAAKDLREQVLAHHDRQQPLEAAMTRTASSPAVGHARLGGSQSPDKLTENDYRQAAKFEMDRFGLTLPEAMKLVKDKRYPGILKTIEDWRAQHGWPAANSPLSRGYVYDLIGMQRRNR